ncbi:MAG: glycosyltransferase family 4 protein [Nitrososphaerales archaeon]
MKEFLEKVRTQMPCFVNYNGVTYHDVVKIKKSYDAIFIGTHDERKGIFDLIKTWHHVTSFIPGAKLVTCGFIPSENRKRIIEEISKLRLRDNIFIKGPVSERMKVELLASSKLFILPSKHEAFPLVVGEAFAAGLPVIAYNISAFKDPFFTNCKAFITCPVGDTKSLAREISKLLKNPIQLSNLANEAKNYIKMYSWDAIMIREREIYIKVLKDFANRKSLKI